MDKPVHTVFDMRTALKRSPGSYQVLLRTPERGLQMVHITEVDRGGHSSIVLEPIGAPENLVALVTLTPGDRFRFQEHLDMDFEVLDLLCEPDHELVMEVRNVKEGWHGRIGLMTGAVDWNRGRYYDTFVIPQRRAEDRGIPPQPGSLVERRRDR